MTTTPEHPESDPFGILGLPRRFDLDRGAVRRAHLAKLAEAHPDVAGSDADPEAARLNDARRVLEDDESRANALLALLGGPSKEADRSLPPGFLLEIMELREAVEAALAEGGDGARAEARSDAEARRAGHVAEVRDAFESIDAAAPDAAALAAIRTALNAWRYTERLIEQLDPGYDPADADFS